MESLPDVRFVRRPDGVNIAYTRWGVGRQVVVYTPPLVSNVELSWESVEWARSLRHGGLHHQVVMIDKRGAGLSDRVAGAPTLDERVHDTLAVMDTEQLDAVDLVGQSEGGPIALALAVQFPQRVRSLTLIGAPAFGVAHSELAALADDDHPVPSSNEQAEVFRDLVRHWSSPESIFLEMFAPTVASDAQTRRWYQRFERHAASPAALLAFLRSLSLLDVRPFLREVAAPTLIMHMRRDRVVHVANGRYLHNAIVGSRYLEYDADDHIWMHSPHWRRIHDDAIEFINGVRPAALVTTMFAAVLFTDIVESTSHEAAVGNRAWRAVLDRHDRLVRSIVETAAGTLVKQTGDGCLATFHDPASAVRAAVELTARLADIDVPVRCGLHAGMVEMRDDGDVTGIAVNIASRVQSAADSGQVLVSETIHELLFGSDVIFEDAGDHQLKGLEGTRRLYAVIPQ